MNTPWKLASVLLVASVAHGVAADGAKPKILDAFTMLDPKTVTLHELKAKIISTSDPLHRKAVEMVADFAKANTWPNLSKALPAGGINKKKYSAVKFWGRSDSATKITVALAGPNRPDGSYFGFEVWIEGKPEWTEYTIPLAEFKSVQQTVFKDGAQVVFPGGVPIADADFEKVQRLNFVFHITTRGTGTAGHFVAHGLTLMEL